MVPSVMDSPIEGTCTVMSRNPMLEVRNLRKKTLLLDPKLAVKGWSSSFNPCDASRPAVMGVKPLFGRAYLCGTLLVLPSQVCRSHLAPAQCQQRRVLVLL
jgi:hypothetical protein